MRLPRKISLGGGHVVEIVLVPVSTMKDLTDDDSHLDAVWEPLLHEEGPLSGRIYIWNKLSAKQRLAVLYHELIHALNDILSWENSKLIS